VIGWYVHHHGRGHLARAVGIAAALTEPVVVFSSLPAPAKHPFAEWIQLARDDSQTEPQDPTASGLLHWVPLHDRGLQDRMSQLGNWIARCRPSTIVVDVSVEVTLLARLHGVPVVTFTGPGLRSDIPHQLAYRAAAAILACWPQAMYDPDFLWPFASKTHYLGAISRFDTQPSSAVPTPGRIVVLSGAGGSDLTSAQVETAAAAVPGTAWRTLGIGAEDWRDDVWQQLASASVVVTHAGQNALAEVAAARRPAVVIPQDRPFAEQREVARALQAKGLAVTVPSWPAAPDWPDLIRRAGQLGGQRWDQWSSGSGATRAADLIQSVGRA
jgi:UDP-N-acetylglucosamine--N-acetylmuramyl-(pentapeptide) pyrophosphoryl-undecaprenol N-acetylglucosamine transferase